MGHLRSVLTTVAMIAGVLVSTAPSEAAGATVPPLPAILVSRFAVHVGGCATDLGNWAKVSGLGDSWIVSARAGGDPSGHRWYLPGNSRFSTVKLTRAAGSDSQLVKAWLSDAATSTTRTPVTITLMDIASQPLTTWTLQQALPVKWSVTPFDARASKTVVETLEFSHQGIAPGAPYLSRASQQLP
jgi:phage tail-like protein